MNHVFKRETSLTPHHSFKACKDLHNLKLAFCIFSGDVKFILLTNFRYKDIRNVYSYSGPYVKSV